MFIEVASVFSLTTLTPERTVLPKQQQQQLGRLISLLSWTGRFAVRLVIGIASVLVVYLFLSSFPVHTFFQDIPHAGPATVYVPVSDKQNAVMMMFS